MPRGISDADACKTLAGIDRTTPLGLRDFAIIMLLHTYRVRGSQVRALRLQDIEWRDNRIRFPATKGGKEVVVPLTDEVGNSLTLATGFALGVFCICLLGGCPRTVDKITTHQTSQYPPEVNIPNYFCNRMLKHHMKHMVVV